MMQVKVLTIIAFGSGALAASLKGNQHFDSMDMESNNPVVAASNSTGANCGVGYTYCGYILKEQKNFDEGTILTAYCAGGYCNSTKGSTDTDPMQALFVCLPESAVPKRSTLDDPPYTGPVKIELLCACSGTPFGGGKNVCLNPDGDHIGRCSNACENAS
ncbi:hypothetical protein N0V93_006801 [Gnomoniopsis smithogilvyi]|uniref:Uncharacterized protein n=1 Tax=Gnomoniopsis smithogilvyi TaxID=1191159 RepID=A0A9W8YQI3_9PEZI|nr:hypothetical protein N0V93_006801 [Gnomoniopsis smithogilvyi]